MTASCEVTVVAAPIALEKIEISIPIAAIAKGKTLDLTAKLVPENATVEGPVVWSSDKTAVASVDQNGRITGVAEGRTVISATLGSVSANCDIEVYSPAAAAISPSCSSISGRALPMSTTGRRRLSSSSPN